MSNGERPSLTRAVKLLSFLLLEARLRPRPNCTRLIRGDKESLVSFGNLIGATARHRNRVGQEQCKRNAKAAVECRESCPSTSRMRNSFGTFEHRAACV